MADLSPEVDFAQDDLEILDDNDSSLSAEEAIYGLDSVKCKEAMQLEIDALLKNKTWELVTPPENRNIISNKWVLTKKVDSQGVLLRHKARLVARGFSQILGLDFTATFAPTRKAAPLRFMFAISASLNLELHHLDVERVSFMANWMRKSTWSNLLSL